MRGHQWQSAEGTIVDVDTARREQTYTIEACNSRGVHVRATVRHKSPTAYTVGSKVWIEIDEHNQMRLDPNAPGGDPLISTMSMTDQIAEAAAAFDHPGSARGPDFGTGPGGPGLEVRTSGGATIRIGSGANIRLGGAATDLAGLASALGGPTAHMIGPDGQQVPVDPDSTQSATSAEQRLAALDQLLAEGMVNQAEYEAQRRRIIESI